MKLSIFETSNNKVGEINLPKQFSEEIRQDLIKRAVLVIHSNKKQPYGAKPNAGKRASASLSKRRRAYRGMYGFGISRVPRKILSRRGMVLHLIVQFYHYIHFFHNKQSCSDFLLFFLLLWRIHYFQVS